MHFAPGLGETAADLAALLVLCGRVGAVLRKRPFPVFNWPPFQAYISR